MAQLSSVSVRGFSEQGITAIDPCRRADVFRMNSAGETIMRRSEKVMEFIDKIKDFFFTADEEDDMMNDVPPVRNTETPRPTREERAERAAQYAPQPAPAPAREEAPMGADSMPNGGRRNKVVNIQTTAQLQVVLVKPTAFTDAKQIADHLIAKKTVVLNLETASPENKRRIIDFLVGVAYANGGSLKPVANLTYIITPYNVGFVGEDLVGELENNGVFI